MYFNEHDYDYKVIDRINDISFHGLEGYRIGSVLFWPINNKCQNHSIFRSVVRIIYSIFIKKFTSSKKKADLCFVYSDDYKGHDDYKTWFYKVAGLFDDVNNIKVDKKRFTFKGEVLINVGQWILTLGGFFDFKASLYYGSILAKQYSDFIDIVNEINLCNPRVITVIDSLHPTDNLITQYGRFKGIKTVTLQHGVYTDVGSLRYTSSDYYLVYGQQTVELFEKYSFDMDSVRVVGMPCLIGKDMPHEYVVKNGTIAVIMGAFLTRNDDLRMLSVVCSLADKLKMRVIVKLHPGGSVNDYTKETFRKVDRVIVNELSVEEVVKEADFATVTQSTVFVENLINCKPTFVYKCKDCIPLYSRHTEVLFETVEELERLIERTKNDSNNMVSCIKRMLRYYTVTEDVEGKYRDIYTKMCEDNV